MTLPVGMTFDVRIPYKKFQTDTYLPRVSTKKLDRMLLQGHNLKFQIKRRTFPTSETSLDLSIIKLLEKVRYLQGLVHTKLLLIFVSNFFFFRGDLDTVLMNEKRKKEVLNFAIHPSQRGFWKRSFLHTNKQNYENRGWERSMRGSTPRSSCQIYSCSLITQQISMRQGFS